VWRYDGLRVIVSGGGGNGMGAAAVRELTDLGAEVHVLDLREPPVDVASYQATDLRDPSAIASAVEQIGGRIDALFNCAGLPGGKFPDLDVMLVNFVGMRYLAELVTARMGPGGAIASISSGAGSAWAQNLDKWLPLVTSEGFEEGRAWCEAHPDEITGGYSPSKEAIIIWTMYAAVQLAEKGIRINCISPGPTDTPMMPDFPQNIIERFPIPLGRHSRPEEQAYPLIFLNSPAASYITGENLNTDGGTLGGISTRQIDLAKILADVLR
jgi:NAD(P)-dependent dehydrogenase (short-subunit alcohol dehydrogenase family)